MAIMAISLLAMVALPVLGVDVDDPATIRISPALPMMVQSPAEFEIWVTNFDTNDPNILLVMTESSYNGLTGDVVVTWTGGSTSFAKADFTPVNTGKICYDMYTVASLQSHLGVPHSENVWYAMGPFLPGPITQTLQTFTVTLPSADPRMLVYAIGKCKGSTTFNNSIPESIPGFVIFELAPAMLALASFSALGIYAVKQRKASHQVKV